MLVRHDEIAYARGQTPCLVPGGHIGSPAGSDPSSVSSLAVVLAAVTRVRDFIAGFRQDPRSWLAGSWIARYAALAYATVTRVRSSWAGIRQDPHSGWLAGFPPDCP